MKKEDIYKKAEEIIAKSNRDKNHLFKCYKAEICPKCGKELVLEVNGKYPLMSSVRCPDNHKLISPYTGGENITNVNHVIWDDSVGKINEFINFPG